jgi:putative ABC transport system permease protein
MSWISRLWWQGELEQHLDKELRFHVEEHARGLMAGGVPEAEARRRARAEFGVEAVKEQCRDARGTRWAEELWQDGRYALRMLRQKPGFTAVALATLALGIGATTVMFTLIHGVLLKPLPYPDAGRLVSIHGRSDDWNTALFGEQRLANPDFRDLQQQSRSMDVAGLVFNSGTLSEPGNPEYVQQFEISAEMMPVLGARMYRGRGFLPQEDRPGAERVAILGYTFWQRHFGGSLTAVGGWLVFGGKRYQVIGVMPADLRMEGQEADVYTPLGQDTARYLVGRRAHPVGVVARLHPDATVAEAQAEIAALGRGLAERYPDTNQTRGFVVRQLRPEVGDVGPTLWLLLGAVSVVLLIACVNVASLLLARAVARERELAMRVALGAGRWRLVRQCVTESAVLGALGGVLGVGLAMAGIRPFVAFWPGGLPRAEEVGMDGRVLLFALVVSVASGMLFGLAPALRVPVKSLEQVLRAGARNVAGASRRMHGAFVASELALAVVLLVSAGMLARTLIKLSLLDSGVRIHNVLTARVALAPAALTDAGRTRAVWRDVLERMRAVPGVEAVAMVDTVPMRQGNNPLGYWTSAALPPEPKRPLALAQCVSPDYLKVMGIPLREGRFLDDRDRLESTKVIVIDEVLARHAFGQRAAVGQRLWVPDMGSEPLEVVGVVGHVRYWGPASDDRAEVRAQLYYPFAQVADPLVRRWSELMSIAVRTGVSPLTVVESLKLALRGTGSDQVLYRVFTMEQLARDTLARQRFLVLLFGVFAALALVLACIGIYGVLSYLTGRRVPEIGVRMAMGASAGDVIGLVLRQSLGMVGVGVVVGLGAATGAERLLQKLVEGMQPTELTTFGGMVAVLAAAALAASFVPARRASRVDPVRALRDE